MHLIIATTPFVSDVSYLPLGRDCTPGAPKISATQPVRAQAMCASLGPEFQQAEGVQTQDLVDFFLWCSK